MLRSEYTYVDGLEIHERVGGRASALPPLVGVHGLGVSTRHLEPTLQRLVHDREVRAPDLPGFGRSGCPDRTLGVVDLAQFLARWLDGANVPPALFLANSMGCQIALELAAHHPHRVDRLVLVGPTVDPAARSLSRQFARLALDSLRESAALDWVVLSDYVRAGPVRTLRTARLMVTHDVEAAAARVRAPVLVVRGSRDAIVPQPWAERLVRTLPHARLAVIPGAPHAAHFVAPEHVADAVRAFSTAPVEKFA